MHPDGSPRPDLRAGAFTIFVLVLFFCFGFVFCDVLGDFVGLSSLVIFGVCHLAGICRNGFIASFYRGR